MWSTYFPAAVESGELSDDDTNITITRFFDLTLAQTASASDEARRGATMDVGVVTPLRRAICGAAAGAVTPALLDEYAAAINVAPGAALVESVVARLEAGFRATAALDPKLQTLVDSLTMTVDGRESTLDDKQRICDQLRDAGDTFLVISKLPTKELCGRFVSRMGWTQADAEKVSFAIYKKKRPQLPVVVVTKTKMEAAASAVDDQDVEIDISGCGLERADIEGFADKLETAPLAVTSLDASANTFHRSGADSICRMCAAAKNLKELSIAGNNIQAPGVVAVINTVGERNAQLTRLDVSNNFLTTEGAQQAGLVAAVAKCADGLAWLGLAGNELCQAAGGEICGGLLALGKIRTLVLNCNKLGSGGIARMAPALKADKRLQHLYLDANDMRDDDVIALADALTFHPTITSLHLRRNPLIGSLGFAALAKLVKLNAGLIEIAFDEESTHVAQTSLVQSLEFNKKKLVSIHHKMVRDGGKDVSEDGLLLWLRMTLGSAELVEHFRGSGVTGESVWSVSGASLDKNERLSKEVQWELFTTLEALVR